MSKAAKVREHHAPVGALRRAASWASWLSWSVREHHAPVGALRRPRSHLWRSRRVVREHHAPVGALRRSASNSRESSMHSQGAPRTCRCIETSAGVAATVVVVQVREHHAPVGALRLKGLYYNALPGGVREHHAPVGALRPRDIASLEGKRPVVRGHHAPVGALRQQSPEKEVNHGDSQGAPRSGKPGIGPRVRRSPMCNPCT